MTASHSQFFHSVQARLETSPPTTLRPDVRRKMKAIAHTRLWLLRTLPDERA